MMRKRSTRGLRKEEEKREKRRKESINEGRRMLRNIRIAIKKEKSNQ
jgi:hypothetical protein